MKISTKIFGAIAAAIGAGLIGLGVSKLVKKETEEADEDPTFEADCEECEDRSVETSEEDE